jgi:hypothetical protein
MSYVKYKLIDCISMYETFDLSRICTENAHISQGHAHIDYKFI